RTDEARLALGTTRVVTVAVTVSDRPVRSMDHQLALVVLGRGPTGVDRSLLGAMRRCGASALGLDRPLLWTLRHDVDVRTLRPLSHLAPLYDSRSRESCYAQRPSPNARFDRKRPT